MARIGGLGERAPGPVEAAASRGACRSGAKHPEAEAFIQLTVGVSTPDAAVAARLAIVDRPRNPAAGTWSAAPLRTDDRADLRSWHREVEPPRTRHGPPGNCDHRAELAVPLPRHGELKCESGGCVMMSALVVRDCHPYAWAVVRQGRVRMSAVRAATDCFTRHTVLLRSRERQVRMRRIDEHGYRQDESGPGREPGCYQQGAGCATGRTAKRGWSRVCRQ